MAMDLRGRRRGPRRDDAPHCRFRLAGPRRLARRTLAIGMLLTCFITFGGAVLAANGTVRIGVLTKGDLEHTVETWPATLEDYLAERIPDARFEMVPLGFHEIGPAVAAGSVDFVLTNSASYVELEVAHGIGRIATLKNLWRDNIYSTVFGAVILARRDNAAISNLADLEGRQFMAVDEKAFGGWTMAWRELKLAGIDPYRDFSRLSFAGNHEAVVHAVLAGKVDAGTVRTGVLEDMAQKGAIDLADIRVIETPGIYDKRVHDYAFPFLRSTRLYPEWPFAKLRHTNDVLAERVAVALLDMPSSHPAAVTSSSAGWTVPLNYQPVHELLQELKLSPYHRGGDVSLATIWQKFRPWILSGLALLGALLVVTMLTLRLNKRIMHAKLALEAEAMERRRTAETLRESNERFRNLVESTNDFVWETDTQGRFSYASPQVARLLDIEPSRLVGTDAHALLRCEGLAYALASNRTAESRPFTACETIVEGRNGRMIILETSGMPYFAEDGAFLGFRGMSRDISDRKHAADALQQEQQRAQITLESIADGVIRTDVNGLIEYINPAASKLTGVAVRNALGRHVLDVLSLIDEASAKAVITHLSRALNDGRGSHLSETTLLGKGDANREFHIEVRIAPVRNPQGELVGSVIVFHDVTEVRRLTREMAYQATHDPLTGLVNRREFERQLERALATASEIQQRAVLAYLDLDQFKVVNDTSGHTAGDTLLRQLGHRLGLAVREVDVLARLGGDEFAVLLSDCSVEEATAVVNNLCRLIKEFRFTWEGKLFQVGVSAGLVEIDGEAGTLTDVLSAADSACYVAKELGRNRIHWYQPDDAAVAHRHGQMQWVHRIKRALEESRFNLYLEEFKALTPIAAQKEHHEILLRLVDEQGEEISPMSFIPAAERYHMMPAVDRWVIASTFSALAKRDVDRMPNTVYAINLSGQSLSDDDFLNFTIQQLDSSAISPEQICFEITETAAIANLSRALRFMSVLKGMGCLFALDDFGSGLSSFAYLKNLPVDYLKIDGSFVRNLKRDPIDRAMVDAINKVGQMMGLRTIAEGAADDETVALIRDLGIDYAQGHGIGELKPLALVSLESTALKRASSL